MTTESTIAQRMPHSPAGAIERSLSSADASPRRDSLQLPRSSRSRVAVDVIAYLSTVAACIALVLATFAWLSKVDAVTYVPSHSIAPPFSADERAP